MVGKTPLANQPTVSWNSGSSRLAELVSRVTLDWPVWWATRAFSAAIVTQYGVALSVRQTASSASATAPGTSRWRAAGSDSPSLAR